MLMAAVKHHQSGEMAEAEKILGVSEPAVSKRLKRLAPPPDTPHFDKLTDKEKRFVVEKVKGKSNIQAVTQSHDVTTKNSAKSMSSQLMAKPEVEMAISELMDHCGINKAYRIRRLKQVIDSKDLNIAHKGLDMSFKLDGSYAAEKHVHGFYFQDLIVEASKQGTNRQDNLSDIEVLPKEIEDKSND